MIQYFENGDYDEEIDGLYDYGYSTIGDVQLGFTSFN